MIRISFVRSIPLDLLKPPLDSDCGGPDGLRKLISFTFEPSRDMMDLSNGNWCRKNPGNDGRQPHITPRVNSMLLHSGDQHG